jgi:hypothetical protein
MIGLARGWRAPSEADRRSAGCLLTVALCGTLPIMITTKQTGYYLSPAILFYALAFAHARRTPLAARSVALGRAARIHQRAHG